MVSRSAISWAMIGCLSVIGYLSIFGGNFNEVFAQGPQDLIVRRVAIWDLFYQGMVAAFVVGALVQGTIVYICWRFRESNRKNRPRTEKETLRP